MELQPGSLLSDKLRLVRRLKSGGMGVVWVAEHLALRSQVAVKLILPPGGSDGEVLAARFMREAAAAAQLRHPNVVQILDYGSTRDGQPFIVMELLDGEDLDARLRRNAPLDASVTLSIVRQVSKALSAAHKRGFVHRDIKPKNIFLIDMDGELLVKVLDFGVAKHGSLDTVDGLTSSGAILGTAHYASPEQLLDAKSVDQRTDLWSVAVVAYQCLTGARPFEGDSIGRVVLLVNSAVFEPPRTRRPDLPSAIDAWFRKALNRDLASRFSSAKELADSFEAALAGIAPESAPTPHNSPPPAAEQPATNMAAPQTAEHGPSRDAPFDALDNQQRNDGGAQAVPDALAPPPIAVAAEVLSGGDFPSDSAPVGAARKARLRRIVAFGAASLLVVGALVVVVMGVTAALGSDSSTGAADGSTDAPAAPSSVVANPPNDLTSSMADSPAAAVQSSPPSTSASTVVATTGSAATAVKVGPTTSQTRPPTGASPPVRTPPPKPRATCDVRKDPMGCR